MANEQTGEKKPALKSIFQWAAAIIAPFSCEPSNRAYDQAGFAYDYYSTKLKLATGPK
jgi:hypothetical protein